MRRWTAGDVGACGVDGAESAFAVWVCGGEEVYVDGEGLAAGDGDGV